LSRLLVELCDALLTGLQIVLSLLLRRRRRAAARDGGFALFGVELIPQLS
jgi:hypothetical protein